MNQQIKFPERQLIELWLHNGQSIRQIALQLSRSPSSVSEEIKRNGNGPGDYHAISAQVRSNQRLSQSRSQNSLKKDWIIEYLIDKLRCGWSPEQIAGRLKREHQKTIVCHETIYRYVYANPHKQLQQYLVRHHHRRRRKPSNWLPRRGISDRVSIHDRPEEINQRTTFGHWELDAVEGKGHSGGIVTALERKSRYYDAQKIPAIDSDYGIWAQQKLLTKHSHQATKSATFDNGKENYNHAKLNQLGIKTYFCDPYCSWQKGSNENHNGILRRYIPKKTDFSTFTQTELEAIIEEINNRPRKCLDYETSKEAFVRELQLLSRKGQVFGFE
jgi:transposase, IS30 family